MALADLAKETGGRKERQVIEGSAENPLEIRHDVAVNLAKLTDGELAEMERLIEKATEPC